MDQILLAVTHYHAVKSRVLAEDPALDEQTLADTIEGLTDLHEIIAAIVRSVLADMALAAGLRQRLREMQDRLDRLEDRISKRRGIVRDVMLETKLTKLTAPDFTVSVRDGVPSLDVLDEAAVPRDFWIDQAPKLDRQSLLKSLKTGKSIAGVRLSDGRPVLNIRVS